MRRHIIAGLAAGLLIPYIGTLAWTGTIHGEELRQEQQSQAEGKRRILLDREGSQSYMDVEEYLPGVLARQIPADYQMEALRAQAVIARTYIYRQMGQAGEIAESALDLDYLESDQMKAMWGSEQFPDIYERLREAVRSTAGLVMTWNGEYIEPMFCRACAGQTRAGDQAHPYLSPVKCPDDLEAEGYLQMETFGAGDFAEAVNGISGEEGEPQVKKEQIPDTIQIISRDESGYVTEVQAGGRSFSGEEIQYALGLQSACFTLEPYGDGVRAVARGIGHGYGLSQTAANRKAEEGFTAEDILGYFYKNIELTAE